MENILHIKASKSQLSKLKNGHNVRISPALEGKGFNLIVHPEAYALARKAFIKGKGIQMKLSPKDIAINKQFIPHMKGTGIFGKKFDKTLDKYGVKEAVYKVGDAVKPLVKAGILGGLATGATALSATDLIASGGLGAGAIPAIYGTAGTLGYLATDYLDNPSKYQKQSNAGGPRNVNSATSLAGQMAQNELMNQLSLQTGEKYNTLGQANLIDSVSQRDNANLSSAVINGITNSVILPKKEPQYDRFGVLISGQGIYKGKFRELSSIGGRGGFVGGNIYTPQALQSQPFSANFQFSKTLPPAFARFSV
jgi:hypothetical protein